MDIFFMILFNLFTGSVIYLVLSLKIERTSSTFQEKRLKREMNEIMTEFNAAAERNISILEKRIAVIKKRAGENGIIKNFDYRLQIAATSNSTEKAELIRQAIDTQKEITEIEKSQQQKRIDNTKEYYSAETGFNPAYKDESAPEKTEKKESETTEPGFIANLFDKISFNKKDVENEPDMNVNDNSPSDSPSFSIEKDFSRGSVLDLKVDDDILPGVGDDEAEDIELLFINSDDKYALMCDLYVKGYSVEELSRFSGIPAGEVKLIISLNT